MVGPHQAECPAAVQTLAPVKCQPRPSPRHPASTICPPFSSTYPHTPYQKAIVSGSVWWLRGCWLQDMREPFLTFPTKFDVPLTDGDIFTLYAEWNGMTDKRQDGKVRNSLFSLSFPLLLPITVSFPPPSLFLPISDPLFHCSRIRMYAIMSVKTSWAQM